jgi:hypothetical protein
MEISFLIKAQAFLCNDGIQGVTELNQNTRQKGHLIEGKIAGDGVGEYRYRACQFNGFPYVQCSACSSVGLILCTVPNGCCGGA